MNIGEREPLAVEDAWGWRGPLRWGAPGGRNEHADACLTEGANAGCSGALIGWWESTFLTDQ